MVVLNQVFVGQRSIQFAVLAALWPPEVAGAVDKPLALASQYATRVDQRLAVPLDEVQVYERQDEAALIRAGLVGLSAQLLLIVDRSPQVQAIFLFWLSPDATAQLIEAISPCTRPSRLLTSTLKLNQTEAPHHVPRSH
jgi:hypothetical protein